QVDGAVVHGNSLLGCAIMRLSGPAAKMTAASSLAAALADTRLSAGRTYGGVMSELMGGCACGAVRYRLTSGPMCVNCCQCYDCQRQVGSAFVINAIIELDRIEVTGELKPVRMPTDSGRTH